MTLVYILAALGLVFGLVFGSFLTVCIARIPHGESIVRPRSRCAHCGSQIRWYDNIPVLSYLLLGGRCRSCRARISLLYPAVELGLGLWWMWQAVVIAQLIAIPHLEATIPVLDHLGLAILGFLLLGLMVMDWQTYLLPDAFTLTGIAAGLFLVCTQAIFLGPTQDQIVLNSTHQLRLSSPGSFASRGNVFLTGPESLIFGRLAAVCGTALLLLTIRWIYKAVRHRDGMGLGDVKLLAMIAAFLGFWPAILTLLLGVVMASIFASFLLVKKQATAQTRLPLGSFLCMGGLIAALCGDRIIAAYQSLF